MRFHERRKKLKETYPLREEWWSRVFASPAAYFILHLIADWRVVTPCRLTLLSFVLVLLTSWLIILDLQSFFVLAAVVLQVSYVIDCMDGQLARYREVSSELGVFLDKCLDYIKFPTVIFALLMDGVKRHESAIVLIIGFSCLFFICFLPYLKEMAKKDFSISSWQVLSKPSWVQRNLRFFLFEEAQWYLIVSVCLVLKRADWALWILCITQGALSLLQFSRVLVVLNRRRSLEET